MAEKKISEMSLEELSSKAETLKKTIAFFIGVIILLSGAGIYITYKQGFGFFTLFPLIYFSILLMFIGSLKNIRKAIAEKGG